MHKSFIIILLSIFFCTCKKTALPPPSENNPIFSLTGTLEGAAFNIIAGDENYALSTDFEIDENDIYTFIGTFAQRDCGIQCQDTFRIKIRNFIETPTGNIDINEALKIGNYSYSGDDVTIDITETTITEYIATIDATASTPPNTFFTYSWDLDTLSVTTSQSVLTLNLGNDLPAEIPASLSISDGQNCNASQTKILALNPNTPGEACAVSIELGNPVGNILTANSNSMNPVTYVWSTGDSVQSIDVPFFTQIGTIFSVTITDSNGCMATSSASYIGQMGGNNPFCIADFSTQIVLNQTTVMDTTFIIDPFQYSTVIIEYINENGQFYSTELGEQMSASNSFSIISTEDFEINENGDLTKKLGIEFDCILYDAVGNSLNLSGGEGVIAVAYPQ